MTEEVAKSADVCIKIIDIKNIRGLRGDNVTVSIKVEFRDKVLGESPKVECTLEQPGSLNWSTNISVNFEDIIILDDIAYRPVVLTVVEALPKEKKQKDDKSQNLGQCTFDLLPLLRGESSFENSLKINPVTGSPLEQLQNEVPQPTVDIQVSTENPLFTEDQLNNHNVMTITMESLYSPPESFSPGASGLNYIAAFGLPGTDEKESLMVFPNGTVKSASDKDPNNKKIRWVVPGSATNDSVFIPQQLVSTDEYENEDGELKDKTDKQFRQQSEKEKNRLCWNMQRRTFLQEASVKILRSRIAKCRKWPVEIFRCGGGAPSKNRKDDEPLVNFHGYAFVNLSPLLFPGVQRIRGAYKVYAFNENDYYQTTERKTGISEEALRIANTFSNQNSTSISGKKGDKKPEKKPAGGGGAKVPGSSMGQHPAEAQQQQQAGSSAGDNLGGAAGTGSADPTISTATMVQNVEGMQYEEAGSYVMLEIQLDRPLVAKRQVEEIAQNVAEYIPFRDPMTKKSGSAEKAVEDYHNQIAAISKQLLVEFRTLFEEELKDPEILNNQDAIEQMRQELLYDLNSTGKYFAFKEQLKYAVIKIVREKYMQTSTITDQEELQEFLRSLFVYLVDELQAGLRKVITLNEQPPSSSAGTGTVTASAAGLTPDQLLRFAKEAEINKDHNWADRYHRERIARNRNSPDYWLDYGVYLLSSRSDESVDAEFVLTEAENAVKECVALNPQHLNGLILYGIICALQNRIDEADIFFEAATTYHPKSIFTWTVRGLFYNSIGQEIQYDMCIQEATRLNAPVQRKSMTQAPGEVGECNKDSNKTESDPTVVPPDSQGGLAAADGQTETFRSQDVVVEEGTTASPVLVPDELQESILNEPVGSPSTNEVTDSAAKLDVQPAEIESTSAAGKQYPKRSTAASISVTKSALLQKASTPVTKSKASFKDLEVEDVSPTAEVIRSIFIKTAVTLLKFRAFAYVEKALAQELIHQKMLQQQGHVTDENLKKLFAEYSLTLAKVQLGQGRYEEAEGSLIDTVQIVFDDAEAWTALGNLRFEIGDVEAAESCFTRALSLVSDLEEPHSVYMRLASLYLTKDKFVEAKQTFLLACKKSATCLSWLGVGIASYRLQELEEAEEALAEANILNNENSEVWGYLSLICLKTNRKLEAEQSYKYALRMKLESHSPPLLEEIQLLQAEVGFGNPEL